MTLERMKLKLYSPCTYAFLCCPLFSFPFFSSSFLKLRIFVHSANTTALMLNIPRPLHGFCLTPPPTDLLFLQLFTSTREILPVFNTYNAPQCSVRLPRGSS